VRASSAETMPAKNASSAPTVKHAEAALKRAVDWLMTQQSEDGGWHSKTYGSMRGGASITALVLYAAGHLPEEMQKPHRKRWQNGVNFLRKGIKKKGFVTAPDGSLDYPAYATAMTLIAARRLKLSLSKTERTKLSAFLLREQLTKAKGFRPGDPDYGGWDLLAGSGARGVTSGSNVSVSSFVLEALRNVKGPDAETSRKLAARWVAGCQNFPKDGGFYFHPKRGHLGNKALWTDKEGKHPRSYGSTTCDGLHCLSAAGVEQKNKRFQAGLQWLRGHSSVKVVPGFERIGEPGGVSPRSGWKEGLRYYFYCRLAPLLPLLGPKQAEARRQALLTILLKEQRRDGSWKNRSARMREDDPFIATCFTVIALSEIIRQERSHR